LEVQSYFFCFLFLPITKRVSDVFRFAIENAIEFLFFNRIIAFYFCIVKLFKEQL